MRVLSIKVPQRKKSGNLFNDPRIWPINRTLTATTNRVQNRLGSYSNEEVLQNPQCSRLLALPPRLSVVSY